MDITRRPCKAKDWSKMLKDVKTCVVNVIVEIVLGVSNIT
jgi:hypothetical protein